jgi:hypothetical protein
MKNMTRKLLVVTAFLGVLSVPAALYGWVAASSYGPDATGEVYVGVGLVWAKGVETTPDKAERDSSPNLKIGYHFLDWFSLQFELESFDIDTYMATARIWDRFYSIRPFLSVGLGLIDAGDFGRDPCAKVGLGVEYFPHENISFGSELAYVRGFYDLDYIGYPTFAIGISLHFWHLFGGHSR